jgi:hypothetical protein
VTRRTPETGQTSLLIVGFFLVAILLVVVVVDASAAYLRRQQLDAVADGAVLAAADGIRTEAVYTEGLGERAGLDPVQARRHVAAYLQQIGARRSYPGLTYRVSVTEESVEVRVSTPLDLPLAPPGWAESAVVTGTAAALVQVLE